MDTHSSHTRRPLGITLLSVVLAWLAIAGFGNALVWNSSSVQTTQHQVGLNIGGWAFTVLALIYGLSALVTSVGLWRMARWAGRAYLSWSCTAGVLGAYFLWAGFADFFCGALFLVVMILVLALGYRYVAGQLSRSYAL